MQRVRVGMTGLAAVGLILMVATAVATGVRRSAVETAAPPSVVATLPTANMADANTEPLAQLGVAPNAKDVTVPRAKRPN